MFELLALQRIRQHFLSIVFNILKKQNPAIEACCPNSVIIIFIVNIPEIGVDFFSILIDFVVSLIEIIMLYLVQNGRTLLIGERFSFIGFPIGILYIDNACNERRSSKNGQTNQ